MRSISFHDFCKDYCECYNTNTIVIRTEVDMQEVLYELYDTDVYEINYEDKIIELD